MKHRILSLMVCLVLITALALPVFGASPLVMDVANLMTNTEEEAIQRYIPKVQAWLVECAQAALEDRKPATISVGDIEATGLNFVKHYYNVENGEKKLHIESIRKVFRLVTE